MILIMGLTTLVTTLFLVNILTQKKTFPGTTINENMIGSRSFSLSSDSTDLNSWVEGTVFIRGEEGKPERVQIIASVEIDPNDWGELRSIFQTNGTLLT